MGHLGKVVINFSGYLLVAVKAVFTHLQIQLLTGHAEMADRIVTRFAAITAGDFNSLNHLAVRLAQMEPHFALRIIRARSRDIVGLARDTSREIGSDLLQSHLHKNSLQYV